MPNIQTTEYKEFIQKIKIKAREAQLKASVRVNSTLLEFYWELGADIVEKQKTASWGSGFLKQMSKDLMIEFPDMKGFSKRNLELIRKWYLFYSQNNTITKQAVSQLLQIPWGHNIVIFQKNSEIEKALFYVQKTMKYGWSRSILVHQIESQLYERSGKAITNFTNTLPKPQSDLANQMLKDPYCFDFLTLTKDYKERELEDGLMEHITKFLMELGQGFTFVGRQHKLNVGGKDFYIDLLFYHIKLYCYVVVELKVVDFEPEFAGKLSFYISAVDGEIRGERDNPTIGILICKSKNSTIVEYALKDINKPIGISEYQLFHILPKEFKSSLPSIEEIEEELKNLEEKNNDL
jgi:predicted nuclease of restriction endonuclease-like (RecB) superfamily